MTHTALLIVGGVAAVAVIASLVWLLAHHGIKRGVDQDRRLGRYRARTIAKHGRTQADRAAR